MDLRCQSRGVCCFQRKCLLMSGRPAQMMLFPTGADTRPFRQARAKRISGEIPTEVWNRLGRTLIPKLKSRTDLSMALDVSVQVEGNSAQSFQQELNKTLHDLNLAETVKVEIR